jgi:hypothetical protein
MKNPKSEKIIKLKKDFALKIGFILDFNYYKNVNILVMYNSVLIPVS